MECGTLKQFLLKLFANYSETLKKALIEWEAELGRKNEWHLMPIRARPYKLDVKKKTG